MAKYQKPKPKQVKQQSEVTISSVRNASSNNFWAPLIALIITVIAFSTSINNDFVNWDDDRNFYDNPIVKNITKDNFWASSKEIFTTGVIGNYNPLPIWTFGLEKIYIGFDKPHRWHLHNLLLHLITVLLVFRLANFLGLGWKGALLVAVLFGIHPLRVESVAWVTERKDVLFGVFYIGALLQYTHYLNDRKTWRWILMTVLFVLSLFSKIQAVSLPLSMLAIDYLKAYKFSPKSIINKIPFLLISMFFGILGIKMLRDFGSLAIVTETTDFSLIQRLFIGAYSFVVYLIKSVLPYRMSPLYPYPDSIPWYFYISMLILPMTLYTLYLGHKKGNKPVVFGILFFIVNIVFLLQILGAGQGFLADRFTYIAYFGLFYIFGYYFEKWSQTSYNTYLTIGAVLYAFVLSAITFNQNKIWKDSGTLWTHVLGYNQKITLPYGNRANFYRDKKNYKDALEDYAASLALKPDQPQVYNSRARLFFEMTANNRDTLMMALDNYNKAIALDSTDGEFFVNRGATLFRLGNIEKAIEDLNTGIRIKPDHAVGYFNRSIMYHAIGRVDLALDDINTYLGMVPNNADLWYEKGRALRILKRDSEAIEAYNQAINIGTGNLPLFYYERAKAYLMVGNKEKSIADLNTAKALNFNNIEPQFLIELGLPQ